MVPLERKFAQQAYQDGLNGIEITVKEGNEYADLKNKKPISQIDRELEEKPDVQLKYERLHASPIVDYKPGDVEVSVRVKCEDFDVYV